MLVMFTFLIGSKAPKVKTEKLLTATQGDFMKLKLPIRNVLIAVGLIVSQGVAAQNSASQDDGTFALEEIVVTAQHRAESLQDVPIAVTALDEATLDNAGVTDFFGIAHRTPGLAIGEFNVGQPQYYIRGVGSNDDGAGGDSSVVVFIDDVYIGRAAGSGLDVFDLERVEVLRGPQGTLFGKNVIGGAIRLMTKKPSEELTGKFEASVGNLDTIRLRGYLSGPLGENVFGKIAVNSFQREGYVRDLDDVLEFNDRDDQSVRGQLRFVPSDTVEVLLGFDYARKRQSGPGRFVVGTGIAALHEAFDAEAAADPFVTFADEVGFQNRDVMGFLARVDWDVGPGRFTSISAFRDVEYEFLDDVVSTRPGAGGPNLDNGAIENSDQFTQEFRYGGSTDKWDYVFGAFFLRENIFRDEFFEIPGLDRGDSFQDNETDSYSVFGQATYALTDRVGLTFGARQTWDSKDNTQSVEAGPAIITSDIPEVSNSESWNAFTPRFALDFAATDDVLLYVSASRGFKSGGFQGTPANIQVANNSFDPEFAWSYETGLKGQFVDNRVRLNLAAFYTDYEELQVLQFINTDPNDPVAGFVATDNAADAELKGVELETTILFSESFQMAGSYAYLDATYSRFVDASGADLSGNPLRNAPENSYNISATYTADLSNQGQLMFHYEHRGQDRAFQDPLGVIRIASSIPSYDLGSARIAYTNADQNWTVALWADNIWDEVYQVHNFPLGNANGIATPGAPRTYGVSFTYSME